MYTVLYILITVQYVHSKHTFKLRVKQKFEFVVGVNSFV